MISTKRSSLTSLAIATTLSLGVSSNVIADGSNNLPKPPHEFSGVVGKTYKDSVQDFPEVVKAPEDAPNIILVMLDDVGFGLPSTFGGLAKTPTMDSLAEEGVVFNRFHTTAQCSPTRAALLTGRNHHQTGNGSITELSQGFEGYNGILDDSTTTVAEILRQNGYGTAMFGKNHNTPSWEITPSGPFDRWPTGLGFEYYYGFMGGETSQWEPQIYENTTPVEPYIDNRGEYLLNNDLADKAIEWAGKQKATNPEKPILMYFSPGAVHTPLHAPQDLIDSYAGKFDMGWDNLRKLTYDRQKELGVIPDSTQLTPRPDNIPAWDSYSSEDQKVLARQMEAMAAFLTDADLAVGRVIDSVRSLPGGDNTLVIYIASDNGASAEGGMNGVYNMQNAYNGVAEPFEIQHQNLDKIGGIESEPAVAIGWTFAASTPFQWMKRIPSHLGGVRTSMMVSWPGQIEPDGKMRDQFHHVVDVTPTLFEVTGISAPDTVNGIEQKPMAGISFAYAFDDANAEGQRTEQYFEIEGSRAIYKDGWWAGAMHALPWELYGRSGNFDENVWELYNLDEDFSQAENLADKYPEKLEKLKAEFDRVATENHVFPLDDRTGERLINPHRPDLKYGRDNYFFPGGMDRVALGAQPPFEQRSHVMTVDFKLTENNSEGVLAAQGGHSGGWALYMDKGYLYYVYNFFGREFTTLKSKQPLSPGDHIVELKVGLNETWQEGQKVELMVDGKQVAKGHVPNRVPVFFGMSETFDTGKNLGSPVSPDFKERAPFPFNGELRSVNVSF